MFTGIVEECGKVKRLTKKGQGLISEIEASQVLKNLQVGGSVAVNGACLTIASLGENFFTADVMTETLTRTNLNQLKKGQLVNLEQALKPDSFLDGHLVTGHVDGTGRIVKRINRGFEAILEIEAPSCVWSYLVSQGSMAVDGVSLAIASVRGKNFRVALIPHTLKVTNLGQRKVGEKVNLEADIIGKYVEKFVKKQASLKGLVAG